MKIVAVAVFVFLSAAAASAHSKMDTTTPADGTVLVSPPTEVGLNFSDKLRLTKVDASHSSGDTQTIDLDEYTSFSNVFVLPLEPMGVGVYEVEWRGLGIDGHVMQGSFTFEVE